MRKLFLLPLLLLTFSINATENPFLDGKYWKANPSIEEITKLSDQGNSLSELNWNNFDPVCFAILNDVDIETIKFLLKQPGNSVDKLTHDGRTYLMWAGIRGNYELIQYLIKEGSDVKIVDDKGNNLVTYTARGGVLNPQIYELYEKLGLPTTMTNRTGMNALHFLAQTIDKLDELNYFIKKGLDLKSTDNNGSNVLHYAAAQANFDLIQELIKEGFNPKELNKNNENALFFAARGMRRVHHSLPIFEQLIKLGLSPTQTNKDGKNVLHFLALSNKNAEVFEAFIKHKVDVQAKDIDGNTPFMNAISRNNVVAYKLLSNLTEDKVSPNKLGFSPYTLAIRSGNEGILSDLESINPDINIIDSNGDNLLTHLTETYNGDKDFYSKQFKNLLRKGVKLQDKALYIATIKESEFLIDLLINSGMNIDAVVNEGLTPLQISAMIGKDTEFMRHLIARGANKNITTEFEETVYELAKENELLNENIDFLK